MMVFVSVTRLRIRSWRFVLPFFLYTQSSLRQCKRSDGFIDGRLLQDRKLVFWTSTVWRDQDAMRRFMTSGAHVNAMPKLLDWCDEASVVHWTQAEDTPPNWTEADRRMRAEGRASKVRNPSENHRQLAYDPPRTTNTVQIARS